MANINKHSRVAFWQKYQYESEMKRMKLQDELIEEVVYNLIIVKGPQFDYEIYKYFNVGRTSDKRARVRRVLNSMHDKKWGSDPLIRYEKRRYCLNDKIS